MVEAGWVLDGLIVTGVVWLAYAALSGPDLFRCATLFIVFGLLLALAWVRLAAPDVAIAEAAIGAGVTGALLLDAVVATRPRPQGARMPAGEPRPDPRLVGLSGAVCVLVGVGLVAAVLDLPRRAVGLAGEVQGAMGNTGVDHEVTAVLLDFRAYDTWLEVGVLLLALVAVLALHRSGDLRSAPQEPTAGEMLGWYARLALPLLVLGGGLVFWRGTSAPGGAFQAGAILAAGAILLSLAGVLWLHRLGPGALAAGLLPGLVAFGLVGAGGLVLGEPFMRLPEQGAGTTIVLVEAAIAVSTALTLVALFEGARPVRR